MTGVAFRFPRHFGNELARARINMSCLCPHNRRRHIAAANLQIRLNFIMTSLLLSSVSLASRRAFGMSGSSIATRVNFQPRDVSPVRDFAVELHHCSVPLDILQLLLTLNAETTIVEE